MVLYKLVIKR